MKKYLGKIVAGVAILLGVLALIMLVAPGYAVKSDFGGGDIKLSEMFFGKKDSTLGIGYGVSIGGVVAMILVIAGVVLTVVALLGKGGKVVPIVAAVLLLVGGILYFCAIDLITIDFGDADLPGDAKKEITKETIKEMKEMGGLGAGAIVGGLFSILAAIAAGSLVFINKNN